MKEAHLLTGPLETTNQPYAVAKIAGIVSCEAYNRQHGTRFLAVMPTNLYGPGDNFDLTTSHVLPALVRKFHLTKRAAAGDSAGIEKDEAVFGPIPEDLRHALCTMPFAGIPLWGTGKPLREFLHVDDLAAACVFLMNLDAARFASLLAGKTEEGGAPYAADPMPLINIGAGKDGTIAALAEAVAKVVGYDGPVLWDPEKPDGTPRKLLDVSRMTALGWQARIGLTDGLRSTYEWYRRQLR
jgi:GDP-L-fucose synthase